MMEAAHYGNVSNLYVLTAMGSMVLNNHFLDLLISRTNSKYLKTAQTTANNTISNGKLSLPVRQHQQLCTHRSLRIILLFKI